MRIERHEAAAWVHELGKLEAAIPERPSSFDREAPLPDHPELHERLAHAARRAADQRRHAGAVIGDICAHFLVDTPSRRGLVVSLRALAEDIADEP